jgi:hypothetical protein
VWRFDIIISSPGNWGYSDVLKKYLLMLVLFCVFAGCSREEPSIPNYLSNAKPGDWARYRKTLKTGSVKTWEYRRTAVIKKPDTVTIEALNINADDRRERMRVDRSADFLKLYMKDLARQQVTNLEIVDFSKAGEQVSAAGKKFDAVRYDVKFTGRLRIGHAVRSTLSVWLAKDAPLNGLIKQKAVSTIETPDGKKEAAEEHVLIEFGSRPVIPNYLASAKTGDWARYSFTQTSGGRTMEKELKRTVAARGGGMVSLAEEMDGNETRLPPKSASVNAFIIISNGIVGSSEGITFRRHEKAAERLKAADKEFDTTRYTLHFAGKHRHGRQVIEVTVIDTWWLSPQAPIDGLVRRKTVTSSGSGGKKLDVIQEYNLLEWGNNEQ